ncbi:MAG: hypothetical protein OJF58_004856 [Enhydrobacter sp.]|nr:MAG: hypothetical protein OJF58_004856 [Enhydrobacter sp.]
MPMPSILYRRPPRVEKLAVFGEGVGLWGTCQPTPTFLPVGSAKHPRSLQG